MPRQKRHPTLPASKSSDRQDLSELHFGVCKLGNQLATALVSRFGFGDCLPDFGPAVRALVGKVDLRQVPMGHNVANVHRKSYAVGADNCG